MTNNRKPVLTNDDTETVFAVIEQQEENLRYGRVPPSVSAKADAEAMKAPYTPPPAVAAWLRTQADKPKGRDIESLMRYHEAHKKGRTDDDCLREKFGGSGDVRRATDTNPGGAASGSLDRGCSAAPTPLQPLPSASTKPHGKDVDTADVEEFEPVGTMPVVGDRVEGGPRGTIGTVTNVMLGAVGEGNVEIDNGEANRFLDRFTGEDACGMGILRILKRPTPPRADVATGGGRVWKRGVCAVVNYVTLDGVTLRHNNGGLWRECDHRCAIKNIADAVAPANDCTELFGPERDAMLAECRKAMGLPNG